MESWRAFMTAAMLLAEITAPEGCIVNSACNCVDSSETPLSISEIQNILKNNGYGQYMQEMTFASGQADGICGDETRAAILAFQKDNDIQCDGCVGDETHSKMLELGYTKIKLKNTAKKINIKVNKTSLTPGLVSKQNKQEDKGQILAYLKRGDDTWQITENDALWFAIMVHAETGGLGKVEEVRYMVWSLINRLGRGWWKRYPTVSSYIQYYSQPIHPSWKDGGSRCTKEKQARYKRLKKQGKLIGNVNPCSEYWLKKREEYSSMTVDTVNKRIYDAVLSLLRGEISPPSEPVSGWFANYHFEAKQKDAELWNGCEGPGSKCKPLIKVRRNTYYNRIDHSSQKVILVPASK